MATRNYTNNFVTPDPPGRPEKPKPERLKRGDLVSSHNSLIDIFRQQQKDDQKAIEGEIVRVDGHGHHSSTSSAAELDQRRRTERMYANRIVAMLIGAFVLLGYVLWVIAGILTSGSAAPVGLLFWIALLGAVGLAIGSAATDRLRTQSLQHTPEALRHQEIANQHRIDLIRTKAEARRYDAGTEIARAQAHLLLAEAQQAAQEHPQQPQQPRPTPAPTIAAEQPQEAHSAEIKRELIHYLIDVDRRDASGRFDSEAPWTKRSGRSAAERAAFVELIEAVNAANDQPLLIKQPGRGWCLNVRTYRRAPQICAAFEMVD